ncbi:MAG: hypothetical protein HKM95_06655 [Inquilinus sp.]|nr:hypothetical protein [Inquilinus sp.]
MAKTLVVEPGEPPTKVPFLRGILTHSLQQSGLPFEEAYALASQVRDELGDRNEITTAELREAVLKHIAGHGPTVVQRYQHPTTSPGTILVRDAEGHTRQFSRQEHRRLLESSGLSYEESTAVTASLFSHMMKKGLTEIRSQHLGYLTYRYLRFALGPKKAQRYLVLVNYRRREQPLVVMIGGASGTGKSAIATELAHRLDIARTQSTDLLREVMRMMIPERLIPVLHRSSYDAWQALSATATGVDALLIDGYQAQADLLSVPCEAVIKRSLNEGASVILEGVHIQNSLVNMVPSDGGAIVIPIMLAVLSPKQLRQRFMGRGQQMNRRRAERYLDNFSSIWRLQAHLLSEADRGQIPIIVNHDRQQVIQDIMNVIVNALLEKLTAEPSEVFS